MNARATLAAARVTMAHLVSGTALALHGFVALALWLVGTARTLPSDASAWAARGPLLALLFWLPGIWVAAKLRSAWPALGPGDEAVRWLRLSGRTQVAPRLGASLGGVAALVALHVWVAILASAGSVAGAGRPEFRRAIELHAQGTILARAGQRQTLEIPAIRSRARLRLEPRYFFGPSELRAPVRLTVRVPEEAIPRKLRLPDFGAAAELQLERADAGTLVIERTSDRGPPVSFARGRTVLRTNPIPLGWAMLALAIQHLPWALLLVLGALATSTLLGAGVQTICLLGATPTLAMLPLFPETSAARQLGEATISAPSLAPVFVSVIAALWCLGCIPFGFPDRRFEAR